MLTQKMHTQDIKTFNVWIIYFTSGASQVKVKGCYTPTGLYRLVLITFLDFSLLLLIPPKSVTHGHFNVTVAFPDADRRRLLTSTKLVIGDSGVNNLPRVVTQPPTHRK